MLVAATAVLLAAVPPAFAQDAAPPVENEVVGPPQLRDFSINGTVTREAPETPVQAPPQQRQERSTATTNERPAADAARPSRTSSEPAGSRAERRTSEPPDRPARAEAEELPPPTPASTRSDRAPAAAAPEPIPQSTFAPASAEASLAPHDSSVPILPWLIAALGLAGAAAWYFLRQRPRESYAGGGGYNAFQRSEPAPAPRAEPRAAPTAPRPAPVPRQAPAGSAASEPKQAGVVSTRLRPWLELEFKPDRAVVDEQKAAVAFELAVYNSGSAPARDVLLEASLFNAGPVQDQQLRLFFENPVAKGDRIPVIPPLQRVAINTAVFLPRDQVKPIEVEGRTLFVPLIAFNALYRWSGGEGQTSASYLVGKETGAEKLGPFRLDQGPRIFRKLAAREHDVRLRK